MHIGPDEVEVGAVTLRDMESHEQAGACRQLALRLKPDSNNRTRSQI